jgi:hypothetical protein
VLSMVKAHGVWLLLTLCPLVQAMQVLDDEEMSEVSGAGIGFFADEFLYDQSQATARVSGLRDSQNRDLTIEFENLYIKGQGSQRGAVDTTAQIGSPLHPFTLKVVGQQQAATLPAATQAMQLKTPHYTDPLNDTRTYGIWSLYQGCLFGTAGCTDPTRAVTQVNQELTRLNQTRTEIWNLYGGQFANLKAGIDADMPLVLQRQALLDVKLVETQAAVTLYKQRQEEFAQAGATRQQLWNTAPSSYWEGALLVVKPTSIGSKYYCGIDGYCENATARAYNQSVDAYTSAQAADTAALNAYNTKAAELLTAQQEVGAAWEVVRNGQTLTKRQADYNTFSGLCGTPTQNSPTCVGGRIGKTTADRDTIMIVVGALQQGGTRVKGMDIGLKTRFSLPSTAYSKNSSGNIVPGATTTRTDFFALEFEGFTLHNSYLNMWGANGKLNLETSLQLYADRLVLSACRTCTDTSRLVASNVYLDVNLGHGRLQPLQLGSLANGEIELTLPSVTWANHVEFYRDVPKSNISLGNVKIGNVDIGSQSIRGLRLDYMKMTTVKLPR